MSRAPVSGGGAYGGRYGWRTGYYDGGNVTTYEYQEGTLIVDLVESPTMELVWRAMIVETLRDSPEKNAEMTNKGVATAFKTYPPGPKGNERIASVHTRSNRDLAVPLSLEITVTTTELHPSRQNRS